MKHTNLWVLLCLCLLTFVGVAQNVSSTQQSIEAIEKTVAIYIAQNQGIELPETEIQRIQQNAKIEGFSSKEIQLQLSHFKETYLRHLFFENNPSLNYSRLPQEDGETNRARCLSQGFEGRVGGFSLKSGTTVDECGLNINSTSGIINLDPNNIPNDAKATIVNAGNDPIATITGHTLNTVRSGSKSLRINQTLVNAEVDVVSKSFVRSSNTLKFSFATVMESPDNNPHTNELPYFKYDLYYGNTLVNTDCYEVNDNRLSNTEIFVSTVGPTIFSDWKAVTIDLTPYGNSGDDFTIKFEMADCSQTGHFGYAYIDDIDNCSVSSPSCPPNQIFVYDVECQTGAGGDASASWNVNASSVDFITWKYSLGPHSNVPLGTTYGNNAGQHQVNWNLPTPGIPIPGSWDNYILVVKAQATLLDGAVCQEYIKTITLSCTGNGGGQLTSIQPNPTSNTFTVRTKENATISQINIRNIHGVLTRSIQQNVRQDIDMSEEPNGIYFVEIKFDDGSSTTKKLLLEQ